MFQIFTALLPIFALVVLGMAFRKMTFPGPNFWVTADRITYYVFLPALLILKLATVELSLADFYSLTSVSMLAVIGMSVLLVAVKRFLPITAASFTSVFQGGIRPNTYVALAASGAVFGTQGLTLTAIILGGIIPLVNVLSIASFSYYVPNKEGSKQNLLVGVISNPLVIACGVGLFLNLTSVGLPYVTSDFLEILSSAALPMGLISVGYGLSLRESHGQLIPILVSTSFKLILLPLGSYFLFKTFGVSGLSLSVAVLFSSVPVSISSYILSGHLNGDKELMASIITVQTLLAFLTMPIILSLI